MQDLKQFLTDVSYAGSYSEALFDPERPASDVSYTSAAARDWEQAEIILIGCGEMRGEQSDAVYSDAPASVRKELYKMFNWHQGIQFADAGDIKQGATVEDTRAALRTVLHELQAAGKIVIVIGGAHDLTLQQYEAFKKMEKPITASVVDMLIDLDETEEISNTSYLMEMLTGQPNYVKHYNHIGFQSYYAHPHMVQTLDKLRFDFFRLGRVREHMEDMEPVLRTTDLLSFDINAVRYSDAPVNIHGSPNGFTGDEACQLARYAGMSTKLSSFGVYGYDDTKDQHQMTAKLIAQMIWYFIDGYHIRKKEALLTEHEEFVSFHVSFTSNDTTFLKSKRSGRWWMQLPNKMFIPCSYHDYLVASKNDIPERWLREQERLL